MLLLYFSLLPFIAGGREGGGVGGRRGTGGQGMHKETKLAEVTQTTTHRARNPNPASSGLIH